MNTWGVIITGSFMTLNNSAYIHNGACIRALGVLLLGLLAVSPRSLASAANKYIPPNTFLPVQQHNDTEE
jgi:hypothetical protein